MDTVEFVETDETAALPPPISIMDLENMTLAQKKATTVFEETAPAEDHGADMDVWIRRYILQ